MKGRDRNAQCWCGSGKKYKKCHRDREGQEKENPWDAVTANRTAFQQKKCYARDVGFGPCDGRIIKAHTVSRGPNLTKIARDGKVVRYSASIPDMNKNGGKLTASEIGIRDASVFHGFCARHDRDLFSCIENESFTGRPDQCLTVAYRTLSRELYGKDAASHLRETLRGADKGKSSFDQFLLQSTLNEQDKGNEAARKEIKSTHDKLTQAIIDGSDDVLRSHVLEFDGTLPFMLAGAWSPFTDFFGKELQDGYANELLEQVFFSSFAGTGNGYLCISWINIDGAPGRVIADQIVGLPSEKQAEACLMFAVKHIENVFYDPDWFEALSTDQRNQLNALAASGMDEIGSPPAAVIHLDHNFDLPDVTKNFYSERASE